jgi:hypothetical protein
VGGYAIFAGRELFITTGRKPKQWIGKKAIKLIVRLIILYIGAYISLKKSIDQMRDNKSKE